MNNQTPTTAWFSQQAINRLMQSKASLGMGAGVFFSWQKHTFPKAPVHWLAGCHSTWLCRDSFSGIRFRFLGQSNVQDISTHFKEICNFDAGLWVHGVTSIVTLTFLPLCDEQHLEAILNPLPFAEPATYLWLDSLSRFDSRKPVDFFAALQVCRSNCNWSFLLVTS